MMDSALLRSAYDDFLGEAASGHDGSPEVGEWNAEQILAHLVLTDLGIAGTALTIASGQRCGYDNRYTLDPVNLARVITAAGGYDGLVDRVRSAGEQLCSVTERLTADDTAAKLPRLIVSGEQLVADDLVSLSDLIAGVGTVHLPRHAEQLAALRRT